MRAEMEEEASSSYTARYRDHTSTTMDGSADTTMLTWSQKCIDIITNGA
jgi:hypothetical protein